MRPMFEPGDQTKKHNAVNAVPFLLLVLLVLTSAAMTLKGSSGGGGGGGSQACAVCKYQRRRCTKDCLLAPYFPADQPKVFQNAHRLFGVSNIQKILKDVPPDQREEAVKSIKYESFIRARFPVHGCCEVIWHLRYQLHHATEQLRHIHARIAALKADQFGGGETSEKPTDLLMNPNYLVDDSTISGFPYMPNEFLPNGGYNNNYAYAEPTVDVKPFHMRPHHHHHVFQFPHYSNFYDHNNDTDNNNNNNYNGNCSSSVNINHNNMMNDTICLQQGFLAQQEIDVTHDYDEMPFDPLADDRQSFVGSKEACESSAESMMRDEFVVENELKNAAACFSLTNMEQIEDRRTFV